MIRLSKPLPAHRLIVAELAALQVEVDALKRLQAESRRGLHAPFIGRVIARPPRPRFQRRIVT